MVIIPAIDIRGGRCVRLDQGDYDRETVFADDPLKMARRWQIAGAKRLHVVDLDGARDGVPRNEDLIRRLIANVDIAVEVGGGMRDVAVIGRYVQAGADRVAIGTAAIKDQTMLVNALAMFGERRIFYTDISRDGMLGGPNFPAIQEVVEHAAGLPSSMAVIASGGIATVEHVQRLKMIGVEGAIIGKALYTGALDLGEAIAATTQDAPL